MQVVDIEPSVVVDVLVEHEVFFISATLVRIIVGLSVSKSVGSQSFIFFDSTA